MASNVRLTWVLTEPSSSQAAIAATRIDARVSDELPWTEINTVAAPDSELLVENVAPGTWFYRAVALDAGGREAEDQPTVSLDVPFELPPGVTELAVALE